MDFLNNFWQLLLSSAPWLLLGFTIAGLIKTIIPENWLNKHLGGQGWLATVKASIIGAPLPLCSCGVVPVALGLRKSGASKNATVSFLVATPETGVDSVSVTYALMGPFMAVVRPIAAITSGIVAGLLVGKADNNDERQQSKNTTNYCASKSQVPIVEETTTKKTTSCCASKKQTKTPKLINKLKDGLSFAFVDLLKDISFWLVVGLLFAAAIETWVPHSFLAQWGDGLLAFIVMALIGVPMYICATASTPIAAGLLLSGVSPGAVLVFMMAGPATNIGTLAIIANELGKRAITAYLAGVIIVSFGFGYLTNYLTGLWNIDVLSQATMSHNQNYGLITQMMAVILVVLMVNSVMPKKFSTN